jgi:hypothetical protein
VPESWPVLSGVIIHLENDMPILVDLEEMPAGGDMMIRFTNVRTLDGKRPSFVHNAGSTFIFPLEKIRLIEVPQLSETSAVALQDAPAEGGPAPEPELEPVDEEADEDLLARIRQI